METILFYRDFRNFSGGHLKVWDYFVHVRYSDKYKPQIFFSRESIWDENNPWMEIREHVLSNWDGRNADILFLAGLDWLILPEVDRQALDRPIINLIQHVRHSHKADPRYGFLRHRAIRICVSEEIKQALEATGQCNGPLFFIPNGLESSKFPALVNEQNKACDILIAGLKNPELAYKLKQALEPLGKNIKILTSLIPRNLFLDELNHAKITVFLPHEEEGFYLPALEGMALQTFVICPDCIGNRSFCLDRYNCLCPRHTLDDILDSIYRSLSLPRQERQKILLSAREISERHTLWNERRAFLQVLENIDQIW